MLNIVEPLAGLPQTIFRRDAASIIPLLRYPKQLPGLRKIRAVTEPMSKIIDEMVTDTWLRNLIQLECFVLGGMLADKSLTAMVGFMYRERMYSTIDYPKYGMQGIINCLVRGLTKFGGKLILSASVESIIIENGRAIGVQLKRGGRVMANRAVVSNASVWDTLHILPKGAIPEKVRRERHEIEQTNSFIHLHVGFDATGLEGSRSATERSQHIHSVGLRSQSCPTREARASCIPSRQRAMGSLGRPPPRLTALPSAKEGALISDMGGNREGGPRHPRSSRNQHGRHTAHS